VLTASGTLIQYDYLVVCPGIQIDWDKVKGLPDALGQGGVTSNYRRDLLPYTRHLLETFEGGTVNLHLSQHTDQVWWGSPKNYVHGRRCL
jgi:NADPH-dependent 2,4-dienoyl-CoA reductase/sulfur reductase-like enzyme